MATTIAHFPGRRWPQQPGAKDDRAALHSTAKCEYPGGISFSRSVPVVETSSRADDIAKNFGRTLHAAEPVLRTFLRSRRDNFGNGFSEARDANGPARLANFLQKAQALRLEFGNGDLLHASDRNMVNYHGQTSQ